ncbi:MAG: hypothetical protein QG641_1806, partial [Candidatus Poribacteria bacterium]|nr:hypothetical protein [Candidatus Poribacteria bacterium]
FPWLNSIFFNMNYRTFGKTGWQVSEISLGGAYLGGQDKDREQENATAVIHRAFELGINYIDTAPYYGRSEELIGNALQGFHHPVPCSFIWR